MPRILPGRFRRQPTKNSPWHWALIGLLIAGTAGLTIQHIAHAADASCTGSPIAIPKVTKKLISLSGGSRPGNCIKPDLLFLHATNGGTLDSNWDYFNGGSQGQGTNAQFLIGPDGTIYQTVELYTDVVEYAVANDPVNERSIAIELVGPLEFEDKAAVPVAQYNAALNLAAYLMQQYNIPIGDHPASWLQCKSSDKTITAGFYGHYQLCVDGHTDPGIAMFSSFRQDLNALLPGTDGSGSPSTTGGRWVPYDAYARPYSWPINGSILQNYGFTPSAQNLGARYPNLYPKGDPGVIFSTTNHITPPPNPAVDKFINPNIDIAPHDNEPSARAVYSTQAGWITFANWAGNAKGYTIQVESDVDGDGQADLATRYMRLQAPQDGQFAPDIDEYTPPDGAESTPPPNADPISPTLPAPFVMEAESMDHAASITVIHDTKASGGKALEFKKNGLASKAVSQPADTVSVRARADGGLLCGWPDLILSMDGQQFAKQTVTSKDWADFSFDAPFDGATHTYSISFANDFPIGQGILCDTNLFVDSTTFSITNPNTAMSHTISQQRIEAESLTKRQSTETQIPEIRHDDSASQGEYVRFSQNGSISDTVVIKEGNWIKVRARGTNCDGWPHMTVKLDDSVVLEAEVADTDWIDYASILNLAAGSGTDHTLAISYANDHAVQPICDRNLEVDVVTVQNNTVSQTTNNLHSLIGKTKYVGFNQLLGYVSVARDREHGTDISNIPNANQTYLSYRIMYNNPNFTTFPSPTEPDSYINARVDNPYIIETDDNKVAGSLKVAFDHLTDPMWFFCALRTTGNSVLCTQNRNP